MKQAIVLVCAVFGAVLAAQLPNGYLPPTQGGASHHGQGGAGHHGQGGNAHHDSIGANNYQHSAQGSQNHAKILRLENEVNVDSYKYGFETDDGTQADESGHLNGESIEAHGSFSFVAPDGVKYDIQYTSGENGFQPQGAHIPTAPPVPEEILKGLEQNAADEAQGVFDDGQYHPEESWAHANGHGHGHKAAGDSHQGSSSNNNHNGYKY